VFDPGFLVIPKNLPQIRYGPPPRGLRGADKMHWIIVGFLIGIGLMLSSVFINLTGKVAKWIAPHWQDAIVIMCFLLMALAGMIGVPEDSDVWYMLVAPIVGVAVYSYSEGGFYTFLLCAIGSVIIWIWSHKQHPQEILGLFVFAFLARAICYRVWNWIRVRIRGKLFTIEYLDHNDKVVAVTIFRAYEIHEAAVYAENRLSLNRQFHPIIKDYCVQYPITATMNPDRDGVANSSKENSKRELVISEKVGYMADDEIADTDEELSKRSNAIANPDKLMSDLDDTPSFWAIYEFSGEIFFGERMLDGITLGRIIAGCRSLAQAERIVRGMGATVACVTRHCEDGEA
jgi:hypothetical protein